VRTKLAGPDNFAGKTVIDVTNPLDFSGGDATEAALRIQHIGRGEGAGRDTEGERREDAQHSGQLKNDKSKAGGGGAGHAALRQQRAAKKQTEQILRDFGWKNITDLGGIEQSRIMEPLCILWVAYGAKNNSWTHAFKILKK
jgi:8-hydroxy-5-deazaflavin:NADPH oxidoreductase